jgi:hypothetical protein
MDVGNVKGMNQKSSERVRDRLICLFSCAEVHVQAVHVRRHHFEQIS